MQLPDRQRQLEDVVKRKMDAEKDEKSIKMYRIYNQVGKDG